MSWFRDKTTAESFGPKCYEMKTQRKAKSRHRLKYEIWIKCLRIDWSKSQDIIMYSDYPWFEPMIKSFRPWLLICRTYRRIRFECEIGSAMLRYGWGEAHHSLRTETSVYPLQTCKIEWCSTDSGNWGQTHTNVMIFCCLHAFGRNRSHLSRLTGTLCAFWWLARTEHKSKRSLAIRHG